MQPDRIQQGSSDNLQVALSVGTTATNPAPDSATVTVVRADGTPVITAAAANDTGNGLFSYPVTPAQTALLDTLTATWTFTYAGQPQSRRTVHEVVGGFVFGIGELAAILPDASASALAAARVYAESAIEAALGFALVPRYRLETITRRWREPVRLSRAEVRTLRSLTLDGQIVTPADIAAMQITPGGLASPLFGGTLMADCFDGYYGRRWTTLTVGYEHGLDVPPAEAVPAALALAADRTGDDTSSIHPRADTLITADGTLKLRAGGRFGLPAVDEFLDAHRIPVLA